MTENPATERPKFFVQTVIAYETTDGKKFHSLDEAKNHTRDELYKSIIKHAVSNRPEFARLEPALLLDFIKAAAPYLPGAINAPFDPFPIPAKKSVAEPAATAQAPIPAARPDASPAPGPAARLLSAAANGLAQVRNPGARIDPGFPPRTAPSEREMVEAFEEEMDAIGEQRIKAGMARGFGG